MVYCCFFEWGVGYLANGLCGFDSYALRAEILEEILRGNKVGSRNMLG